MTISNLKRADTIAVLLVIGLLLAQVLILSLTPLNLSADEAYYWLWSRKLGLSYYEKGPGIPLLIALGCKLFGDTELGVRFGALLCQFILSLLIYSFVARHYSRSIGLVAILLYLSSLTFGTLGLFMTGDPPLCFFWTASLLAAVYAIDRNRPWWWTVSLLAVGVAALFKYTSLALLPSYGFLLLLSPTRRKHLWSNGFMLGTVLIGVCFLPIVIWNQQHHWINFAENSGHFSGRHGMTFRHVAELVFGQWGLVGIFSFPLIVAAFWHGYKMWRRGDLIAGLYLFSALPLAGVSIALSLFRPVYANWPMPVFIGGILLLAHAMSRGELSISRKRLRKIIGVNAFVLLGAHMLLTGYGFGLPPQILPTKKLVGWNDISKAAGLEFQNAAYSSQSSETQPSCDCEKPVSFVVSEKYTTAAEISFYSKNHLPSYVADPDEPKLTQFDVWSGWEKRKGTNALLVFSEPDEWKDYASNFCQIIPASNPQVAIHYGQGVLRDFYLYRGCAFNGADLSQYASAQ